MKTIDVLGCYVGLIRVRPKSPLVHFYEVNELEDRCRTSTALFLRLIPLPFALVVGRWKTTGMSEAEMFSHVFKARNIDLYDEDGSLDPRFSDSARATIAQNAQDPDDEWEILQACGLDE